MATGATGAMAAKLAAIKTSRGYSINGQRYSYDLPGTLAIALTRETCNAETASQPIDRSADE
jgi:hypothetical protein